MKLSVSFFIVVLSAALVHAEETCVDEKIRIQRLMQQVAQLQANNAQLLNNVATQEEKRLQALKVTAPVVDGNGSSTAPTAPVAPPPATPPQ